MPSVGSSTVNASSPSEAQTATPINTAPVLNQDTKAKGKKTSPAPKAQDAARYDEDSERVFDFTEIQEAIGVPAPEVVPQICSFFNSKRGCRNGDKCKHLHERIKAESEKKVEDPEAQNVCRFFNSKRGCRNGDKCKSLHVERVEKQRASNEEMISPFAEPRVTKVSKDSTQMKPLAKEFVPTASNISEDQYMSGSSSSDSQYFENEDYQQDENQQQYPNHQYPGQQYQSSDEVFPSVLSPVPVYTFGSAAPDPIASLFTQTLLPPSSANGSNQMFDSNSFEESHPGFSPPSSAVGNGVGYVPASSSSFFGNSNGSGNSSSTAFDFTGGMARGMGAFGSQPPLSSRPPPGLTKQPSASFLGDAYQQQQHQQSRSAMLSKSLATLNSMLDRHSMSRMQLSQRIEEGHSGEYWQHDMAEMTRLNDEIKCLEVSRILLLESLSEACRQEVMY
ncbi:hypothetical protein BCR33DRAFT_740196 [Rhizoclosmatium globosum]|uniref:C3H1-type domain-containing protein n=1 Tax=Rhizoclosmatium globosum TaxID=329046 RepID=A0A1Y2C1N8_9FUNG|nr:hypothetical protein BCR33DRAFT_740196 [Rhizoclosmatium globosum]|eukprot:ORY40814.1 hypothetical protein BCR33DRAFT_740196 [Rhizoclosmatium globosum]